MRKFHESVTQAWKKKIPGILQVKIIESAPWTFACTLCNMYQNQNQNWVSQSGLLFVHWGKPPLHFLVTRPWRSTACDFFLLPLHLTVRCPFLCLGSCIPYFPLEPTAIKRNFSPLINLVLPNFRLLVLYFTIVISRVQKSAFTLRKTRMRNARHKFMYWTGYQRGVRRAWVP